MVIKVHKTSKKKSTRKYLSELRAPKNIKTESEVKIERILIENFVALQKVMTNLSVKFEGLTSQITKLLDLFEISAKALAEKDIHSEKGTKDTEEILKKVDNLMDQNKLIARGLTLVHEKIPENVPEEREQYIPPQRIPNFPSRNQIQPISNSPFPKPNSAFPQKTQRALNLINETDSDEYQKSISSEI